MRILIVEDDIQVATFIRKGLQQEGYAVDHAANGENGLHLATTEPYDAAIVDIMLPKLDGISLIGRLREKKITTPVLVLSARSSVDDRVKGLQAGGDDYLVKPFAFAELLARVRALLRRRGEEPHQVLRAGEIEVDLSSRKARVGREALELTRREFDLLAFLLQNQGRVVTREMLVREVWKEGVSSIPMDNVIDVYISRLRKKVDKGGGESLIRTVRGVGFILERGST